MWFGCGFCAGLLIIGETGADWLVLLFVLVVASMFCLRSFHVPTFQSEDYRRCPRVRGVPKRRNGPLGKTFSVCPFLFRSPSMMRCLVNGVCFGKNGQIQKRISHIVLSAPPGFLDAGVTVFEEQKERRRLNPDDSSKRMCTSTHSSMDSILDLSVVTIPLHLYCCVPVSCLVC